MWQSTLAFTLSHIWLPTQKMNVIFPDMTPHGMLLYVRVSEKTNNKMIKWYNEHLILIILPHLVIGRNRTHNFKSSCLYMSYFPSIWRKNHFVQSSYKITYIACSQIYYISFPNMRTRFESNNVCIFYLLLIFLCCIFYKMHIYIPRDFIFSIPVVDRIPVSQS